MQSGARANDWRFQAQIPVAGTRPSGTAWGVSVTPAQNAYGAYVQLMAAATITDDIWLLEIVITNIAISTAARDGMITIGVDTAGGTAYVDTIIDLVCGPAIVLLTGGGVVYKFNLKIPAGSSIGVKGSVNSATLTAFQVGLKVWGDPTDPTAQRAGSYVDSYGANLATSAGTAVTEGTASEGAYVAIGTLTRPCFAIEYGIGFGCTTMVAASIKTDIAIGDATNKQLVIVDAHAQTTATEQIAKPESLTPCNGSTGSTFYGRTQHGNNATAPTNVSIAVYAVGG